MRIYNSLSGQKEDFTPMVPGRVGFYVCGITPYDMCHLGHARTYVTFDVAARYLRASGLHVDLVKNFTDVDDKIISKANKEKLSASEISERYIKEYEEDMAALGIMQPTEAPRVTTHIKEVVELIEKLFEQGAAYAAGDDVYFEVNKFPDYLKLSKRSRDDLEARVESDERKRDPADFALWKSAKPGEPFWESPFGKGRPGWHIECSAMALKYLGETFDLHGGGRDLIFPHHENEIAQSEAATHKPFAKIWMHAGMLNIDNEKMSKSLGNFFTIREVLRSTSGEALRAFFLNAQYRGPMGFDILYRCPVCKNQIDRQTAESLQHNGHAFTKEDARNGVAFASVDEADKRLTYVYKTLHRADAFAPLLSDGPKLNPELCDKVWANFAEAMDDDFNTTTALSSLSPVLSYLNELLDKPPKPKDVTQRTVAFLAKEIRRCGEVLGLYQAAPQDVLQQRRDRLVKSRGVDVQKVEALIAERGKARAEKRFTDADALRTELQKLGVVVQDAASGTSWEFVE